MWECRDVRRSAKPCEAEAWWSCVKLHVDIEALHTKLYTVLGASYLGSYPNQPSFGFIGIVVKPLSSHCGMC
ncbi:Protein of unknown function [Pyronema omphalodes CBS 100304]|uniref:Uncharacterized protein n=1 Tax=Pyronema omphalodes (strain CBS 100304) TaxID=1076935 RepID=U4L3Q7_PYROM|nr:Protein of unknown function [Pyronema omphalodes CBS 100304]